MLSKAISAKTAVVRPAVPAVAAAPRPVPVSRPLVLLRASDADRLGDKAEQTARDAQKNVSRGAEDVKDAAADTGDKIKSAASNAGEDSEGLLKKAQKNVNRAAEGVKDNAQEAYDATKKNVNEAAENVKEGAQDLGDRIQGKQ